MLTTPATAPEPQAADAPPVTMSTDLIKTVGTVLRSLSLEKRRPSSSTSVRLMPRPRRSTGAIPALVFVPLVCGEMVPRNCGRSFNAAATLDRAPISRSCLVTCEVGVGASKPRVSMRDPVTTMSDTSSIVSVGRGLEATGTRLSRRSVGRLAIAFLAMIYDPPAVTVKSSPEPFRRRRSASGVL